MAITFGSGTAPSQVTINFDSVFGISLANYRETLTDNISASNSFLYYMKKRDFYESCEGGTDIREPLLTALATGGTYDGYDELSTTPTDGITDAVFEWRQMAVPVTYNMKEIIQNRRGIKSLAKAKMQQGEEGIIEMWATHFFQGSGNAAGRTPKIDASNGSSSIEPIAKLIDYLPTVSLSIGNINQSTSAFWRNKKKEAAASTYDQFLFELDNIYNSCALGSGGPPDLITMDQTTYELFCHAYFQKWRVLNDAPADFPFEAKKFKKAMVVMEDKVGDAYSDLTSAATYGTAYIMNTKYFRVRYLPERNYEMLVDENGKTFKKPINGDSRVGHIAWMGNVTVNNRRKQGVYGKIARTLT